MCDTIISPNVRYQYTNAEFYVSNKKIMRKTLFGLMLALAATMLLSSCKKNQSDQIVGTWVNTDESVEITIAGQQHLPADLIKMEFTSNSVLISDERVNCIPDWHRYTLAKQDGKLMLHVEGSHCLYSEDFEVEQLDKNQLVLAAPEHNIDWDFHYVMRRTK